MSERAKLRCSEGWNSRPKEEAEQVFPYACHAEEQQESDMRLERD